MSRPEAIWMASHWRAGDCVLSTGHRGQPRQCHMAGPRTTHNRTALMHDSMVERNGARTGPALESGVTGSSGSFSKGLGATPVQPSNCLLVLGEHSLSLCSTSQPADHCQASHRCTGSRHCQRNPTDWYGQVGRNIGTARGHDAVDPRVPALHSARVLACWRAGVLLCLHMLAVLERTQQVGRHAADSTKTACLPCHGARSAAGPVTAARFAK